MSSNNELISSTWGRFSRIAGMTGKLTFGFMASQAAEWVRDPAGKMGREARAWEKRATILYETLSRLKGGAMKVGQMLSLQEGMFPKEFTDIMKLLQSDAKPIPFSSLREQLLMELPDADKLFSSIDEQPLAAASIGQVHRAKYHDGRDVVIKIQYPGVEDAVKSDLKNLKTLFKTILNMLFDFDVTLMWKEIEVQLLKELDYKEEMLHQQQFRKNHHELEWINIARVIPEACTLRVLTSEYLPGMTLGVASATGSQKERDQWGENLFALFLFQMYRLDCIHADPNAGNFAFLPGGKIILYDFGQIKYIPPDLRKGYRDVSIATRDQKPDEIPEILRQAGIKHSDGGPVSDAIVSDYTNALAPLLLQPQYTFGPEDPVLRSIMDLGRKYFSESGKMIFPADIIFIDRTMGGLAGNFAALRCSIRWPDMIDKWVRNEPVH